MARLFMKISMSDQLTSALCNTLLHSLWQGIILAAIAGLIVVSTRKASSALRYNLLISALMLFAVGVFATFIGQYLQRTGPAAVVQPGVQPVLGATITVTAQPGVQPIPAPQPGFTERVEAYLNDHHNTIVLIWFLIICARSLQLGVGLYGTYRIKRVRVAAVKGHWPGRMQQLADGLGIRQTIAFLESGLAKTPMVIGHLKPVVLVPIGLLAALSTAEVEAILIHELAHIRRRDYLVNMLQSLLEIVFFFNPAVLWISKMIKTERENCCDDLALAQDHNKANYIRALVSCEEYKSSIPAYAMAFPGGKNTLLHRVKRMANNRNHSLNLFEKTVLAVCLVGVGLFMTAFSSLHHKPQQNIQGSSHIQPTLTPPASTQPASIQPSTTRPALAQHRHAPQHKDTTTKPPLSESATALPATSIQAVPDPVDTLEVDPYSNTGYNNRPYRYGYSKYADQQARYKSEAAQIKIDLMKDGLVTDTNHIHFTINDKEFILNGVMQSPAVFQQYKTKYDPNNGQGWSWTHGTER
jgi:beta-lactamase regulating signal transducer with metallopeptidase domain